MNRLLRRFAPLAATLACTLLAACPSAANHTLSFPDLFGSGDESTSSTGTARTPVPLASGQTPFPTPIIHIPSGTYQSESPSPSPSPSTSPKPSADAAATDTATTGDAPTPTPTRTPNNGLLGSNVGPSPIEDPTAGFFTSPSPFGF